MGLTPKDSDAKVRLGYVEKDSIVWADGREKLVGRDWRNRVKELQIRSGGKCERFDVLGKNHHRWCLDSASEPHHVQKRSVLRDDRLENLAYLSHWCHAAEDNRIVRSDKKERRNGNTL